MLRRLTTLSAAAALFITPLVSAQELAESVTTKRHMVVTANPLATAAGAKILKRGGTAADAMVAVQAVLGLVEPQSSGLGGGAFIVYYDAFTGETTTIDAREKAPAAATEDRFVRFAVPGGFFAAWQSGLSVGVPGVPRMMEFMQHRYGNQRWRSLFQPAIKLARDGFPLTQRTTDQVTGLLARNASCQDRLFFRDPVALAYFANPDDCTAKPAGTVVTNPDYVQTLKTLIRDGANGFYTGPIAASIVDAVINDQPNPGDMTVEDLANYEVIERAPVCIDYRGYDVCGMGPPSSGALAVGQILGVLENFDMSSLSPLDVDAVHLFTQAGRLAFADRGQYVGDSDFVNVPVAGMLNKAYLESRAALISQTGDDIGSAAAGVPPGVIAMNTADPTAKNTGTSHVSIVDDYGNALSMTTTIESSFGNGVMVHGFLLNNELTDFSFNPGTPDAAAANRVQANKRPRSSMSPTIVFNSNGGVELVTGSPGGSRIIGYTAQSIVNHIDFGLDPQASINVPHYMNRNGSTTDIETPIPGITLDYDAEALEAALDARAHNARAITQTSGLSIIHVAGKKKLIGGADKRRDGTVGGK